MPQTYVLSKKAAWYWVIIGSVKSLRDLEFMSIFEGCKLVYGYG
jgi:hypothetical protein